MPVLHNRRVSSGFSSRDRVVRERFGQRFGWLVRKDHLRPRPFTSHLIEGLVHVFQSWSSRFLFPPSARLCGAGIYNIYNDVRSCECIRRRGAPLAHLK